MSLIQPDFNVASPGDPGLTLNLSSNNPFRNRATSPSQLSPNELSALPRPVSRNPFLDAPESAQITATSPTMSIANAATAPKVSVSGEAAELFDSLTLNDKPKGSSNGSRPSPSRSNTTDKNPTGVPRSENIPPRGPPRHRPTRSQEEAMRARRAAAADKGGPKDELNIFADPTTSPRRSGDRRPRRNSESSVLENGSKRPLDPEEEKRRQERRRREREKRHRERDSKSKKPDRKLDIIDQLDATSIYGTGLFHHDGPFDACNPHRNRQGSRRAPMQAFPKDSLNNVLGGGGPLNKRPDHAAFLGNNDSEAFKDYSKGGAGAANYESYIGHAKAMQPTVLSPLQRVEPIHGEESLGLGTSTFLEGAPASRNAIQRRNTETDPDGGGLGRKKSLAQKIRGISNNRREYPVPGGRITSPEGVLNATSPRSPEYTPGGTRNKGDEKNPFFNEYRKNSFDEDKKDGKQSENITIAEPEIKPGRARAPSSPGIPEERLERRVTGDGNGDEPKNGSMGFLSRVKSLKTGGRRPPRPEKPAN